MQSRNSRGSRTHSELSATRRQSQRRRLATRRRTRAQSRNQTQRQSRQRNIQYERQTRHHVYAATPELFLENKLLANVVHPEKVVTLTYINKDQQKYLDFTRFTQLKILNIVDYLHNPIVLESLKSLDFLGLFDEATVPDWIYQLKSLKNLLLCPRLTMIPENLLLLENLQCLSLQNNQITSIPESIGQLIHLTSLILQNNQITSIPATIGQLKNLTMLFLQNNQITYIPDAIRQLKNLATLALGQNQITEIPKVIGQLRYLTLLDLQNNKITVIPDSIGQLKNLTTLVLADNHITIIPEAISRLKSLSMLTLENNQITEIPDAMGQLSNLTTLELNNNPISVVPVVLGQLKTLRVLNLNNTQIKKILLDLTIKRSVIMNIHISWSQPTIGITREEYQQLNQYIDDADEDIPNYFFDLENPFDNEKSTNVITLDQVVPESISILPTKKIIPESLYDVYNMENIDTHAFLKEPGNILFSFKESFFPMTTKGLEYLCRDKNYVKYACLQVIDDTYEITPDMIENKPYLALRSLGASYGLVSLSQLKTILYSQDDSRPHVYQITNFYPSVKAVSTVALHILTDSDADFDATGASHCGTNQDDEILDIQVVSNYEIQ